MQSIEVGGRNIPDPFYQSLCAEGQATRPLPSVPLNTTGVQETRLLMRLMQLNLALIGLTLLFAITLTAIGGVMRGNINDGISEIHNRSLSMQVLSMQWKEGFFFKAFKNYDWACFATYLKFFSCADFNV